MLTELHIENIAVIEKADIELGEGLCVLTGETGAGKSIVIDSLEAILGGRTSRDLVRTGTDRASVTAVFTAGSAGDWLEANGIDGEDGAIVRRRVASDGKSSASVNGTPVTAAQLRELGSGLLDIHGQNDGRQLMDESRHRAYLDSFAGLDGELEEYRGLYRAYRDAVGELKRLSMDDRDKRQLMESLEFRVSELSQAELREGEEAELLERAELLRNSEKLTEAIDAAYAALYGGDGSASELSGDAMSSAARAGEYAPELKDAARQIGEARELINDAAERLRDFRDGLDFSEEEFNRIETRLALLRRLEKKYMTDEAGLISALEESRARLEEIEFSDQRREKLAALIETERKAAYNAAKGLTEKRAAASEELRRRIEEGLRELNMPSVRFQAEITPQPGDPGFDESGRDTVRFLMSANAGETPGRIARIASGGELSRIMLVMKDVLSRRDRVETMVFDEIDEGVSGVAAQRVGEKLARLSGRKQVICVTHLPQIAAMADCHYLIKKSEREGRTYTAVTALDRAGRLREIARLHGGENITETTLRSAGEQLDAAESYKLGIRK